MTPQEETVILEARDILGRYLSQNPVIGSWQALMDYCAFSCLIKRPIHATRNFTLKPWPFSAQP